jgi:hypothetical protein
MQPRPRTPIEVVNAGSGSFQAEAPYCRQYKKSTACFVFSLSAIWPDPSSSGEQGRVKIH